MTQTQINNNKQAMTKTRNKQYIAMHVTHKWQAKSNCYHESGYDPYFDSFLTLHLSSILTFNTASN